MREKEQDTIIVTKKEKERNSVFHSIHIYIVSNYYWKIINFENQN
jgi:hypothetical protein